MTFKTFYYDQQVVVIFFFCFCLIRTVASSKGAALIHTLHSKDNILLEHKPLITMLFVHMKKKCARFCSHSLPYILSLMRNLYTVWWLLSFDTIQWLISDECQNNWSHFVLRPFATYFFIQFKTVNAHWIMLINIKTR